MRAMLLGRCWRCTSVAASREHCLGHLCGGVVNACVRCAFVIWYFGCRKHCLITRPSSIKANTGNRHTHAHTQRRAHTGDSAASKRERMRVCTRERTEHSQHTFGENCFAFCRFSRVSDCLDLLSYRGVLPFVSDTPIEALSCRIRASIVDCAVQYTAKKIELNIVAALAQNPLYAINRQIQTR